MGNQRRRRKFWGIGELKTRRIGELVDVVGKVDLWLPAIEPPGGHFFRKLEKRGIGESGNWGIGESGNGESSGNWTLSALTRGILKHSVQLCTDVITKGGLKMESV